MLEFSESAEFRATSRGTVDTTLVWFGMLRQIPSAGDYGYWVAAINGGTDRGALIDALLQDPRYAARFGGGGANRGRGVGRAGIQGGRWALNGGHAIAAKQAAAIHKRPDN